MRRKEFLRELKYELRKRRDIDVEEVIFYYDELIQDAVDTGENEGDFIRKLGSTRDICRKIIDDEDFLIEVREKNRNSIRTAVSITVKVFSYFVFFWVAFAIVTASFSLFASGIGIVGQTVTRMIATPPSDSYGYIMLIGFITVGISLIFISIGLSKIFFRQAKPALLKIFRSLNGFRRKEGK